ncbi:Zn2 DNA-binding protein [Venustampulla echinocandica]|uniref:Zn2 DNA-binding protein n=1 Tax=Venustampulla echinocandica TaxID=2656787 RepID=A0A370TSK5_9HELO|nr:Zn2 DNA-binding protein [Venustampulla echinocandica]RDL38517.1 Zn2 DNA-binding protein [Venustampulla echinocandica]
MDSHPHAHPIPHPHQHPPPPPPPQQQHPHSHNFALPSVSPTDYFHSLELTPAIQHGPRSYKSRKYRPCDFCRARQVACKIDLTPPCQLCSSHGRQCTFVERPKKKRRPNASNSGSTSSASGLTLAASAAQGQHFDVGVSQLSPAFIAQYSQQDGSFNAFNNGALPLDSQSSPTQLQATQDGSPIYTMDPYLQMIPGGVRTRPLDSQSTRSARLIGETGESNPYLLRHYTYDENDECTTSKLTYRRITSAASQDSQSGEKGQPPVVFMLADDSLAQKGEPRVEDEVLAQARSEVASMISEQEALRLLNLFFRFVYPYFPILCKSEIYPNGTLSPVALNILPLSLLCAIYATALHMPFVLHDDVLATTMVHDQPPAQKLYRISWLAVTQELHTPRLATLQACLLLLQRAPTNRYTTDTPWKTSLVGWTVSLAQSLGLTRECSDWTSIPPWETALRKRLWYGVLVMDKWASLGAGMPSHIRTDDFDVLPLSDSDLEPPSLDPNSNSIPSYLEPEADAIHFRLLSELTMILSDIMDSYYSLRATQRTSRDFHRSLELATPLRSRLRAWNESLPPALSPRSSVPVDPRGMVHLSANPSLTLAYIVATMTLFRALLRPLDNLTDAEEADQAIVASRQAVRSWARECANEVVEFVENLGRGALDSFWHSWSRANFAIASSFLMQLLLTAESEAESNDIHHLVTRWRCAMRVGSGSTANGLMSLGLLRLDGLLNGTVKQQHQHPSQSG